jgi:hypothetical protein
MLTKAYGQSRIYAVALSVSASNVDNFIGISGETIAANATGKINTLSDINTGQSSLTIGSKYYLQANGTLGTTVVADKEVGIALSATDLLITYDPATNPNYTNADVDTHLNTSTASASEVLSWTGSDYDWVAQNSGADLYAANESSPAAQPSATGTNAIAIGDQAVSSGTDSFAIGTDTDSTGTGSLAVGQGAQATANYNLAIGLNANATAERAIAIGNNGVIAGSTYSTAIGHNSGFGGSVTATGSGAMALGGSYASGADSFAAAMVNNTSSYGAQGINSIAMGTRAKSLSNYGVAIGFTAIATQQSTSLGPNSSAGGTSGTRSTAVGYQSQALGSNNTVIGSGSRTTTALYSDVTNSVAIGSAAISFRSGQIAFGTGRLNNEADSQYSITTLRCITTNNTQTVMTTDNSTATDLNQINLRARTAMSFKGMVVARESVGSGTDCAAFEISGLIRQETNGASTTVLVNSAITVIDNQPNWGLALSADTTLGGLKIQVTGAGSTTIIWVAPIQCAEVLVP